MTALLRRTALVMALCVPVSAIAAQGKVEAPWWDTAVIYQIYPRSFQDSNGDGIGDLQGIIARLDYIKDLGADAIWLSPIYPSPNVDFGYDVADYTNVDPAFGTLADFDALMRECKARNIRVLMDMVLNHTSDKHKWFIESASSRNNPKRDWYVWNSGRPGKDGKGTAPINNWQSLFGHSAWQWNAKTNDYYYHLFYAQQPDLNWRNPDVRKAMYDAVRFWLDRGVAGYRLDALDTLFEVADLRDASEGPGLNAYGDPVADFRLQSKLPEVHDVLRELRVIADGYGERRLLVGEMYTKDINELASWYGAKNDELHLPMDLHLIGIEKLEARAFRTKLEAAQTGLNGNIPLLVTDNHDQPRSWDRWGDGANNEAIARIVATVVLGQRSSSILYYGQEIGMVTSTPTRKEDVKDTIGITGWPKEKGRDGERTPMQWDTTANAGFSTAKSTWLPVPPTATRVNVAEERDNPHSLLHWYKDLIALRRANEAMRTGTVTFIDRDGDGALVWVRTPAQVTTKTGGVVIATNMTDKPLTLSIEADIKKMKLPAGGLKPLLMSDDAMKNAKLGSITLPPFGVYIGEIKR